MPAKSSECREPGCTARREDSHDGYCWRHYFAHHPDANHDTVCTCTNGFASMIGECQTCFRPRFSRKQLIELKAKLKAKRLEAVVLERRRGQLEGTAS